MKLRNKKTGEIRELPDGFFCGDNLKKICEEWEDYEEPKEYWHIDDAGVIQIDEVLTSEINMRKSIGNYFDTREEAEKAVEKLKAWKRLKDKGYRVMMNNHVDGMLYLRIWNDATDAPTPIDKAGEIYKDLDLLFGGKE